jgi:hypothetical protein
MNPLVPSQVENALIRWVFSHTTQGASHPPGRPHSRFL